MVCLHFSKVPFDLLSEVEENRELAATGQLCARLAQFVKECVRTRLVYQFNKGDNVTEQIDMVA